MDDQVAAAMKRWPDIPDVYGWLRLDRRGRWLLIDRNMPSFDEARDGHGSTITNTQIVEFIGRNYLKTDDGRWYWQNGPQRAFAELDVAPWIYRVMAQENGGQRLITHGGDLCETIDALQLGDDGVLYVLTEHGPGAVHDLDLAALDIELTEPEGADNAATGTLTWNGRKLPIGPLDARMTAFVKSPLQHSLAKAANA